ncbi:MAG: hypothetical protein FD123_151 [Bacteroidetes bacterium]|nr:MAG: hypothetical protein FD123_151 [Bacteroidota bacterium]
MKKLPVVLLSVIVFLTAFAPKLSAQAKGKLKISYVAVGTIEGYSYPSKMKVYIDGKEVGEGPVKEQTVKNTFTVEVPQGQHEVRCVLWAQCKGVWEERLVSNDYSFDWSYAGTLNFKKKNKLKLEFNVTKTATIKK